MLMFIDIVMISTVLYLLLTNRAVSVVSIFCVRVCVCVCGGGHSLLVILYCMFPLE